MYRSRLLATILLLAAFTASSPGEAAEPVLQSPGRLLDLVKPHEKEALAVRFMVAVSPIALPEGVADCTVAKATPLLKEYFARLYAGHLGPAELHDAVAFFESKEGQTAVALGLQHEQGIYTAAAQQERIASEHPAYPPQIQKALDRFAVTPAGKVLTGKDEVASRQPFRSEISELRDAAFGACIQARAAGKP